MEFSIYFAILAEDDGILQTILRMTSSLAVQKTPRCKVWWGLVVYFYVYLTDIDYCVKWNGDTPDPV